jgi:hypothetical protein
MGFWNIFRLGRKLLASAIKNDGEFKEEKRWTM